MLIMGCSLVLVDMTDSLSLCHTINCYESIGIGPANQKTVNSTETNQENMWRELYVHNKDSYSELSELQ